MRLDHITPKQLVLRLSKAIYLACTTNEFENCGVSVCGFDLRFFTSLPGGISEWVPPDPIPNSEVKLLSADDSVGFLHVKVGHCQAFIQNPVGES